jgi:hypothetical protein
MGQRVQALAHEPCRDHYRDCLWQARRLDLWRRLRGEATDLLSLDAAAPQWNSYPKVVRGFTVVPVGQIVGSVGRTHDFTRDFWPRGHADRTRWIEMDKLVARGAALPPVYLYQLGQSYFVLNGHHRVSVARINGIAEIDAHVVELVGGAGQTAPDAPVHYPSATAPKALSAAR